MPYLIVKYYLGIMHCCGIKMERYSQVIYSIPSEFNNSHIFLSVVLFTRQFGVDVMENSRKGIHIITIMFSQIASIILNFVFLSYSWLYCSYCKVIFT